MPGEERPAQIQDFHLLGDDQRLKHILQLDATLRTLFMPQGFFDLRVMDEAQTAHPDPGDPPAGRYRLKAIGGTISIVDSTGTPVPIAGGASSIQRDKGGRLARATGSTVTIGTAGEDSRLADSTDTLGMFWTGLLTAGITVSGANGLDAGAEAADTWYAVHVIGDTTGASSPASLLSLSQTAPALPAGYDVFRQVGWVRNNASSNFINFRESGKGTRRVEYLTSWAGRRLLINGALVGPTAVDLSSLIPPGVESSYLHIDNNSAGGQRGSVRRTVATARLVRVRGASQVSVWVATDAEAIAYDMTAVGGALTIVVGGYEFSP